MERSLCRTVTVHGLAAALLAGGTAVTALAQTTTDLALVSLEDLMNIEITSASRKEQRADAVPGAVYVISQDDIRRSGMTTVPELLRLVPGLQVAEINANKWAISSRGFNGLFSNKLLVLVDGRSIYDVATGQSLQKTSDLDVQYRTRLWSRHDVVVGAGSRTTHEVLGGGTDVFVTPAQSNRSVSNMFVQDEIALAGNRVHVTLGSKLEHDTYASWGVQPTAFSNHYSGLQTNEPITPYLELVPGPPHVLVPMQYGNLLDADTQGIEFAGRWQPVHGWRLDGSYTGFRFMPHVDPPAGTSGQPALTTPRRASSGRSIPPCPSVRARSSMGRSFASARFNSWVSTAQRARAVDIPALT